MKKNFKTGIYTVAASIMSLTSFSLAAQNVKKETVKASSIPIKIKYMDNGKVIPNATVYFLYYDSEKPEPVIEKTANTGDGKIVSFNVPLDKDGASFPFVVLYTKDDVNKAKEIMKTSTINAYRTPAGENCEFLQLSVTKDGGVRNDGCSMQMWSMGKN
jgi:hypothetical protein